MRETPDEGRKRLDLSVPQVAGSALAAVVAAKLASYFGVYGTIFGAGVVSIVATCGGSVLQQVFRSSGEQLRAAKTIQRPRMRAAAGPPAPGQAPAGSPPGPAPGGQAASGTGEFGSGTVYRARVKSWKRPLLAAALVFGVTMGGITVYELASGSSFSGGSGTTVSDAVDGRAHSPHTSRDERPAWTPSPTPSESTPSEGGAGTGSQAPEPSASPSQEGRQSQEPSTAPSTGTTGKPAAPGDGASATPTPREPSASSRSGTAVPDPAGSVLP